MVAARIVAERFGKKENVLEYFSSRRLLLNPGHYNLLSYWSCSVINDRTKSTLCNKTPQPTIDTPIQNKRRSTAYCGERLLLCLEGVVAFTQTMSNRYATAKIPLR